MPRNTLIDLNNHLFEQLERLNDEELDEAGLEKEITRTKAMASMASVIVQNASIMLDAAKLQAEYMGTPELPPLLKG